MSEPYIGEIRMFGGNFAPVGWMLCQGQLLNINDYDVLFALIGTTYGGDGMNTFALPNLASRIPIHEASGYPLGQMAGAEQVTLIQAQLPVHSHQATSSQAPGTQSTPAGNLWATASQSAYSAAAPDVLMSAQALSPAGGGQPHENMPPFLTLNFIISTFGIYPSQA